MDNSYESCILSEVELRTNVTLLIATRIAWIVLESIKKPRGAGNE
jgi:hypothetical protein